MDQDRALTRIKARNALRREAKLPLLDENVEVARGLAEERHHQHRDLLEQHGDLQSEYRAEALAEYETRHGRRPRTGFGWWVVYHHAQKRFETEIERRFGTRSHAD